MQRNSYETMLLHRVHNSSKRIKLNEAPLMGVENVGPVDDRHHYDTETPEHGNEIGTIKASLQCMKMVRKRYKMSGNLNKISENTSFMHKPIFHRSIYYSIVAFK